MRIKAKEENDIFLVKTVIENRLTDQQSCALNKRKQQKDYNDREIIIKHKFFGVDTNERQMIIPYIKDIAPFQPKVLQVQDFF